MCLDRPDGNEEETVMADSCEAPHFQYHVSGQLAIRMDDGTEMVAGPGGITSLPSGRDAWVIGDEPVVVVDRYGVSNYAKGSRRPGVAGPNPRRTAAPQGESR